MNGVELKEGAIASITRVFISRGLRLIPGAELAFSWKVTIEGVVFKLRVCEIDPSFRMLPLVRLQEIPDELPFVLPHVIGKDRFLCYLDTTGKYFDPFEPEISGRMILDAIEQTLLILLDEPTSSRDFGIEFGTYWEPKCAGYLMTTETLAEASLLRTCGVDERERLEAVIYSGKAALDQWCKNRSLQECIASFPALVIQLKESTRIPHDRDWPPTLWSDFLSWLYKYHPGAELNLLERLIGTINRSLTMFIVLIHPASGPFGIAVSFKPTVKKVTSRFRKGKPKGKNNLGLGQLRQVLKSPMHVHSFERWGIENVTDLFLTNRNLVTPSLENKKIAVMGCGTVGAHVANLLTKVGAGAGKEGELALFDGDTLRPSNIGRHFLGVEYLGENKAAGVADKLKKLCLHPRTVPAHGYLEPDKFATVFDYSLIIDATGDEQISTLLSFAAQRARQTGRSVAILHVWIDANGLATRALLDDGTGGCYRCLKIYETSGGQHQLMERFGLFRNDDQVPEVARIHYQCGESYVPFSEGVSVIAAGMGQQMATEYLSGETGPRFRHISLHSEVKHTKSQNLSRYSNCPCCSPRRN